MDLSQVKIETKRLLLVSSSQKYAENIFSEYRDPVTLYMNYGPPTDLESLKERLKLREDDLKTGELFSVVVLLKNSGEFLGSFTLENLNKNNPELGGWLKRSAQGHGYGLEAVNALKHWWRTFAIFISQMAVC